MALLEQYGAQVVEALLEPLLKLLRRQLTHSAGTSNANLFRHLDVGLDCVGHGGFPGTFYHRMAEVEVDC
jgi:hypothetical protein